MAELCKYVAICGFSSVIMAKIYESHMTEKVKKQQYYKEAINHLNQHSASELLLGKPVGVGGLDLFSGKGNRADSNAVSIYLPVKGSKTMGELFFKAEKSDNENDWVMKQVVLEIKDKQGGKVLIYDGNR